MKNIFTGIAFYAFLALVFIVSRKYMRVLILITAAVFAVTAQAADQFYLPITKHFVACSYKCPPKGYNEQNHVIGATNGKYAAFAMNNSYGRSSVFVGRQINRTVTKNVTAFAVGGIVTGYEGIMKTVYGVTALAYVGVDIHKEGSRYGIIITSLPVKEGVVNVGFRVTL